MNLNKFARKVALKEGGHTNLKISDVKEVMKILFTELAKLRTSELQRVLMRYK